MEYWESLVNSYEDPGDLRSFSKALQTAESVLKEDLAVFEIEWYIQTLLHKPVNILHTIQDKHRDDSWSKPLGDAFKLMADIVNKYPERIEHWIVKIVELCSIQLDARTRTHSLHCLNACARTQTFGALIGDDSDGRRRVRQYVGGLEEGAACRAPMAVFVGTICECHPEAVADEAVRIWRIYLNMLDSNKNTDTVISAVLQGINGLLKNFGSDLPIVELSKFFEKLSTEYIRISKCEPVILSLISSHVDLFRESVCSSRGARAALWAAGDGAALAAAYRAVADGMSRGDCEKIITQEILPYTKHNRSVIKYTALRLVKYIQEVHNIQVDLVYDHDVYTLEFELRNPVSYDVAEAISFCIECNLPNSEKVLQSAILFYNNIPENKRKDIVVNGIFNSSPDIMMAHITCLIEESCLPDMVSPHLPLWRDILQARDVAHKQTVVQMYVTYLVDVLDVCIDGCGHVPKLPEKLQNLLTLTSHVFTLLPPEDYTNALCSIVLSKLVELTRLYGVQASCVAGVRSLVGHVENEGSFKEIYDMLSLDHCKDESLLCELCLAVVHSPDYVCSLHNVIMALEIIFTRKDAEPKTLLKALKKLERIINNEQERYLVGENKLNNILKHIEKLRNRKGLVGKEARALQRELTIFTGKYVNSDLNNNIQTDKPKFAEDNLYFDIPNTVQGDCYKINLSRILDLAIIHEEEDSLKMLLIIVSAHPEAMTPSLQRVTSLVWCVCARVSVRSGVCAAHIAGGTLGEVVEHIIQESSPGVRRLLSDLIEGVLMRETACNEELLSTLSEKVLSLMGREDSKSKLAGLDITEAFLPSLNEKNILSREVLPNILVTIAKTNELESYLVFDKVANQLMDKIELFTSEVLDKTVEDLLKILLENQNLIKNDIAARTHRNVLKSTLNLIKNMYEYKDETASKVVQQFLDICQTNDFDTVKCLNVMSEMTVTFDLTEKCQEILECCDNMMLDKLFSVDMSWEVDDYKMAAVLTFLTAFSDALLKCQCQKTLKYIFDIINNLKPTSVKKLKHQLSDCVSKYKKLIDVSCLEMWSDRLTLKEITESIERNNYLSKHFSQVEALKIILDVFDLTNPSLILTTLNIYATKWTKIILKTYATGYIKHLKAEMSYLTDLLSVSLRFLTVTEIKYILKEGHGLRGVENEKVGVDFGSFFMTVFDRYLVSKPFLLLSDDMTDCCHVINSVVKMSVRKRCNDLYCDKLLELVDQLWPTYVTRTTNKQKHSLLLDLTFLPKKLPPESNPMKWVVSELFSESVSIEDKVVLIGVLPGGESYGAAYRHVSSSIPPRLSEVTGSSRGLLRAVLDAAANTADDTLIDIICCFASANAPCPWWQSALSCAAATLSSRPAAPRVLDTVYARACDGIGIGVTRQLLVPLLRYSPPPALLPFLSPRVPPLLDRLRSGQRPPAPHYRYQQAVVNNTRALEILHVVFEKIPPPLLESPTSPLYTDMPTDKSWQLVRDVCKLCVTLRDRVTTPEGASEQLVRDVRSFHCAAYNCMCACISVWKPDDKIYQTILDLSAWPQVIDCNEQYELPIRAHWNTRTITAPVSIDLPQSSSSTTSRSRMFLRTLSENPLLFDLIDGEESEQVETQDISLPSTPLNTHPCAVTLSALLRHVAQYARRDVTGVTRALGQGGTNIRWMVTQAICNSKEELIVYASEFAPGLVAVVADTAIEENGKRVLNGLHVDIFNTLSQWGTDSRLTSSPQLNQATEYLITTCLVNSHRQSIYRTLIDVIGKFVEKFASILSVSWSIFEDFTKDPSTSKSTFTILQKLTKSNIFIPELIPQLIVILSRNYHGYQLSKLAELFGLALKCLDSRGDSANITIDSRDSRRDNPNINIDSYMVEFKKVLNKLKKTNVSDYIKLVHYSGCCDESQFRSIVDLTQKLPQSERNKCIEILSTYIARHPDAPVIDEMPHDLREIVDDRSSGRVFDEFFASSSRNTLEPLAKRPKLTTHSEILNTMGRSERSFSNVLAKLAKKQMHKLAEKLCKSDMAVRLTECFYVYIYIPMLYTTDKYVDMSVCLSQFFDALFSHLKSQEKFIEAKLRDKPLEIETETVFSKILTNTKSYAGTLRSYSYSTTNRKSRQNKDTIPVVDVQVPVHKILDTFLQFAKSTPDMSIELLIQLINSIKSPDFDSRPVIATMLSKLVTKCPILIELCRFVVDDLCQVDGITTTIGELNESLRGTEAEDIMGLLHEEVLLRTGGDQIFVLGSDGEQSLHYDSSMQDDEFSIEDLVSSFKKLSSWDCLTFQQRKLIESPGIPALWTDGEGLRALLEGYTETTSWFGKMVELYKNNKQESVRWVRETDRHPRRHFDMSAITEALQWHDSECSIDNIQLPFNMRRNDCMAEWAARLMIRSAYLTNASESENEKIVLSRSHESVWCERVTEMALPSLALQCIKKRTMNLNNDEVLPWLEQKVFALRTMGIIQNNSDLLTTALEEAEKYTSMFYNQSSPESIFGINTLMLQLNYDLKSLTPTKIDTLYKEIVTQYRRIATDDRISSRVRQTVTRAHDAIMVYYDDLYTEEEPVPFDTLARLVSAARGALSLDTARRAAYIALVLNRARSHDMDDELYGELVGMIKLSLPKLPVYFASQIRAKLNTISPTRGQTMWEQDSEMYKVRKCLKLVCDPDYTLLTYCCDLDKALTDEDESEWRKTFDRMKDVFFENEYLGSDFLPLLKYKKRLYAMQEYDISDKASRQSVLHDMSRSLRSARSLASRRVTSLCPALAHITSLPGGERVASVFEEIKVYTDSVARPCVLSVRAPCGSTRRFIVKRERPPRAAAAQCGAALMGLSADCMTIPLSDDCAIITYLEDHTRLRDMVSAVCKLDDIEVVRASRKDDELVLAPPLAALAHHEAMCGKVPAYSLRNAIMSTCGSTQEFINKKRRFEETLAAMTVLCWLFGLGDRHLNNLLYSSRDGAVRCIDWGAILEYGAGELPAARLTRNLLAVCDVRVLECRLQSVLSAVRASRRLHLPIIKLCFENTDTDTHIINYMESLIRGSTTSCGITRDVLNRSNKLYKQKYLQMLDTVCEHHAQRELYTVEEQVSCLLTMSTDPRILSVVRSGWEPWV